MKNITTVLEYHERTKHRPSRYAASLGYMDWATQPDPYRRYQNAPLIPLTHSEITPPYHLLFGGELPSAPLCLESISQLLRYSLGLAAIKSHGGSSWALRCNASSGNLQPTECYLISPAIESISDHATLTHYAPREHALELLHTYESPLEGEGIYIALSSVIWREAWKYGERCWRYCQLDAGHAYGAIKIASTMLGWKCDLLSVDTLNIASLCGLDQRERFHPSEWESPDMLIRIAHPQSPLPQTPPLKNHANLLSPSHHEWPILEIIDEATQGVYPAIEPLKKNRHTPVSSKNASEVILKRRSAQMMDGSGITMEQFRTLLESSLFCTEAPDVHFILFVQRVEGLDKGLYTYVRNENDLETLKISMDQNFLWENYAHGLYCLQKGDYRGAAQMISCNQEIAKDGAFSFGMLCNFSSSLEHHGAIAYKNLYHQCGMIGQALYLEATSLGLSATGIGCFLDDEFHALLGLGDQKFQSLYHFTIGRAIVDTQITTLPPYGEW